MGSKDTREKRKRKRKERKPDQDRAATAKPQGARKHPGAEAHSEHGGAKRKKEKQKKKRETAKTERGFLRDEWPNPFSLEVSLI